MKKIFMVIIGFIFLLNTSTSMAVGSDDVDTYEKINENIVKAENELEELFKGLDQSENREDITISVNSEGYHFSSSKVNDSDISSEDSYKIIKENLGRIKKDIELLYSENTIEEDGILINNIDNEVVFTIVLGDNDSAFSYSDVDSNIIVIEYINGERKVSSINLPSIIDKSNEKKEDTEESTSYNKDNNSIEANSNNIQNETSSNNYVLYVSLALVVILLGIYIVKRI